MPIERTFATQDAERGKPSPRGLTANPYACCMRANVSAPHNEAPQVLHALCHDEFRHLALRRCLRRPTGRSSMAGGPLSGSALISRMARELLIGSWLVKFLFDGPLP
jgi:hypothetical protein